MTDIIANDNIYTASVLVAVVQIYGAFVDC